jgi:hypothetical protein
MTWTGAGEISMFLKKQANALAALLFGALLTAGFSGCGDASASPTSLDPVTAQQTLTKALEAWKAGQPHDAPSRLSPPIRVADEYWLGGTVLLDFAVGDVGKTMRAGAAIHWPVTLTVRNARGKTVKQGVTYLVATSPEASVIRQD